MELFNYFMIPLLLTLGIETIVLFILKERRGRIFLFSLILNCVTNLTLNFILYFFKDGSKEIYFIMVALLEILIWLIEGVAYYGVIKKKSIAIKYTLACNMTSFLLGILIQLL
ncbi:MAG: hypothetical protein K2N64_06115 [Anaeroplasmataceae bacterium]|nr:hypothetical protein [Anaeroplasmataceae bacterium]